MNRKKHHIRWLAVLLCICLLMISMFPLSVAADETPYARNLQNGSFESQEKYTGSQATRGYTYANVSEMDVWQTTATDQKVEFGWLKADGTSPHMANVLKVYNFIETVANEASSLYQHISLTDTGTCTWQFSHRGRTANADIVAMIIGPKQTGSLDKTSETDHDMFMQMLSWLKVQEEAGNIIAPTNGNAISIFIYTAPWISGNTFDVETGTDPFSDSADAVHTQKWQVNLCASNNAEWNVYRGNYTPDAGVTELTMAFTTYLSMYVNVNNNNYWEPDFTKSDAGNLLDEISFLDNAGNEKIIQGSFEDITVTGKYLRINAANHSKPNSSSGWSTTATGSKRFIEVGKGDQTGCTAYGITPTYSPKAYIRDGSQYAELNATEESSLYQYVSTEAGMRYDWRISHRGRTGLDTMALVIGPKQDYDPKKTSKSGRDQMMQIVDWLKTLSDTPVDISGTVGCSQKIPVFTTHFNDSGGFEGEDPFSLTEDATHTEYWNVWLITSDNDKWYDYGSGVEGVDYEYSYIVPENTSASIFSFVSYEPAPKTDGIIDYSFGNLLDCLQFDAYYRIQAETTPNGAGTTSFGELDNFDFDEIDSYSGWGLSDSTFRIIAKPGARAFLGAIINNRFYGLEYWTLNEDGTYYHDFENLSEHTYVRLIYAAQQVVYDANGGNIYQYDLTDPASGPEVPLPNGSDYEYISHTAESDIDGWKFMGWQYTAQNSTQYLFDAVHRIVYISGETESDDTLEIHGNLAGETTETDVTGITGADGITMVAQWKYRQRSAVQTHDPTTGTYVFDDSGGTISRKIGDTDSIQEDWQMDGNTVGKDIYVDDTQILVTLSATPNPGWRFAGWYDENGNKLSASQTYSYTVEERLVRTAYARFEEYGNTLTVKKTVAGNGASRTDYFGVQISLENARADTLYKLTGLYTVNNVKTASGQTVKNPASVKTDANGSASVVIYINHDNSAVINNLPAGTTYRVEELNYAPYGYTVSYTGDQTGTINGNAEVVITNTRDALLDLGAVTDRNTPKALLALVTPAAWLALRNGRRRRDADEERE